MGLVAIVCTTAKSWLEWECVCRTKYPSGSEECVFNRAESVFRVLNQRIQARSARHVKLNYLFD